LTVPTQAERSAATCERLLDATVACIIERGYKAASLPEICKRAGLSRGAQLHHFATKEQLVAGAVDHLFQLRLQEVEDRLAGHASRGAVDLTEITEMLWSVYTGETFYAWLELVLAARTNAALRELMADVDRRFVARAERMCRSVLFSHVKDDAEVTARTRLILAVFDGLATHAILTRDPTLPKRALRVAVEAGLFVPKGADA
jgi:AcrR family transcriptional regulator